MLGDFLRQGCRICTFYLVNHFLILQICIEQKAQDWGVKAADCKNNSVIFRVLPVQVKQEKTVV